MNKTLRRIEEDDIFMPGSPSPLGFTVKSKQLNNFSVHINTEVQSADHYSRVFDMMLDANEHDIINFFIASPGGDLEGLNVLLEGIRLTDAHVCAVIIGSAHSAASILALNCHEVVVTDSASMLCHDVRTGFGGKLSDMDAYTAHTKRISTKLLQDTYAGFLSEKEFSRLQEGCELWLDADQIRERLEKRVKFLENASPPTAEKLPEAVVEVSTSTSPKSKKKKSKD